MRRLFTATLSLSFLAAGAVAGLWLGDPSRWRDGLVMFAGLGALAAVGIGLRAFAERRLRRMRSVRDPRRSAD